MTHKIVREGDYLFTENKEAHLPLNGAKVIPNIHLLPPLDQELDRLAYEYNPVMKLDNEFIRAGFKAGFNKAKEIYHLVNKDYEKVVGFERELYGRANNKNGYSKPLYAITTNSQGHPVWVGKYIY